MPGKILVLKFFQSIRLKQFLIINVFGKNQVTSQLFFIELIFKQEAGSEEVVFRSSVARSAFQAIRLHDSLIINILGENQLISSIFMHAVSHQGKTASETTTVVGFGQLSFLSNWIADYMINNFFENNHLISQFFAWSQAIRKVPLETIAFGWFWLVLCILSNWIPGFFGHQYLRNEFIPFSVSFLFISWHHL